jgi:hypothetical protein
MADSDIEQMVDLDPESLHLVVSPANGIPALVAKAANDANNSDPFAELRARANNPDLPKLERRRAGMELLKAEAITSERLRRPSRPGMGTPLLEDPRARRLAAAGNPAATVAPAGVRNVAYADDDPDGQLAERRAILQRLKSMGSPREAPSTRPPAPARTDLGAIKAAVVAGISDALKEHQVFERIARLEAQRSAEVERAEVTKALRAKFQDPETSPAEKQRAGLELLRQQAIAAERSRATAHPGLPVRLLES